MTVLLAAGLVTSGVAECAGIPGDGASRIPAPVLEHAVAADEIATYPSSGGGMDAAFYAPLVREDGCLYAGTPTDATDDSPLTLMVFPREVTTWDGTTLTVGEESWRLGDTVTVGGGLIREPSRPYDLASSIDVPDSCVVTDDVWLVATPWDGQ